MSQSTDTQEKLAAKRAEIVALITGHGFGVEVAGCAEFCNHTHHFTVGQGEVVHDNPWVGNFYGCADQVPDGDLSRDRAKRFPSMKIYPTIAEALTLGGEQLAVDLQLLLLERKVVLVSRHMHQAGAYR